MKSAAVNNSLFAPTTAVMPAGKGQKVADINQNFGDVFSNAGKNLQQPDTTQTQDTKKVNKSVEQKPAEEVDKTPKTVEKAEPKDEAAQAAAKKQEPVDEAASEEIEDAVKKITEAIKKILGISDDELLNAMESMGIQPFALLNSDIMAQLLSAITGEDSISLVADEGMYASLQEIVGAVDAAVAELLEDTGLTEEELNAILKELESNKTAEPVVDMEELLEEPEVVEEEAPKITVEDRIIAPKNDTVVQEQMSGAENDGDVLVEIKKPTESKHENSDAKSFDNQQGNVAQDNQNNPNSVSETSAAETTPESYISETTQSIIRQLADSVRIVRTEQLTEMELQLHPASLGTVNVSLSTKGGVVTAEFITQSEAVRSAIEAQAVQLRENLEEQGVKVEAIEVSVASHQMERNLDDNGQDQRSAEEQETNRVQGLRRRSINFNSFEDDEELIGEMSDADDATRIAMEMMSMNGNSMDLLA